MRKWEAVRLGSTFLGLLPLRSYLFLGVLFAPVLSLRPGFQPGFFPGYCQGPSPAWVRAQAEQIVLCSVQKGFGALRAFQMCAEVSRQNDWLKNLSDESGFMTTSFHGSSAKEQNG